jgi:hypothetical protein
MSKINPLYILGFFLFMALLMIYQNSAMEKKIALKAQENAATQMLGKKVAALKSQWKDPKAAQKRVDAVLGLRQLKSKVTKRQKKARVYYVTVSELSARELDTLSAKLLNETVIVKSLKLTRNGDRNVTAEWEFAL